MAQSLTVALDLINPNDFIVFDDKESLWVDHCWGVGSVELTLHPSVTVLGGKAKQRHQWGTLRSK